MSTIKVQDFAIPGLKLITPMTHSDSRGSFRETYNVRTFAHIGLNHSYVQDNQAHSLQAGTVRGLHFQRPPHSQSKLLQVLRGSIFDVSVDLRRGSPTFARHVGLEITAASGQQLFVPEGLAHGYCTLEPMTDVFYKVTDFYDPSCDGGLLWNDPALKIEWPAIAGAQISDRDKRLPTLHQLDSPFTFDRGSK